MAKQLKGLARDLAQVITDNGDGKHKDIEEYAEKMAECIKQFIINQPIRVVEQEIPVVTSRIKTTSSTDADVKPDTLMGPYAPLLKGLKEIASAVGLGSVVSQIETLIGQATRKVAGGGATTPPLDLKDGGENGSLIVDSVTEYKTQWKGKKQPDDKQKKTLAVIFEDEINDNYKQNKKIKV